jgi:hypothetical protein
MIKFIYLIPKSFNDPTKMNMIGYNLYIADYSNLWKTDTDLNVLLQFNTTNLGYFDIYYNTTNR